MGVTDGVEPISPGPSPERTTYYCTRASLDQLPTEADGCDRSGTYHFITCGLDSVPVDGRVLDGIRDGEG